MTAWFRPGYGMPYWDPQASWMGQRTEGAHSGCGNEDSAHDSPHGRRSTVLRRQRRQRAAEYAMTGSRGKDLSPEETGEECNFVDQAAKEADDARIIQLAKDVENGSAYKSPEEYEETKETAIKEIRGEVRRRSFESAGCRLVQQVLAAAKSADAADLCEELHGSVREAVTSLHANYVIAKVIEVMPMAQSAFVAQELRGTGVSVAKHRFGCRILCRLLEHAARSPDTKELIHEVLEQAADLCRHSFAHHVISAILEQGMPEQKTKIFLVLNADVLKFAMNRNASYVIEKALTHLAGQELLSLAAALANSDKVVSLATNQFASFVVKALLGTDTPFRLPVAQALAANAEELEKNRFGTRVLQEMEKLHIMVGSQPFVANVSVRDGNNLNGVGTGTSFGET